MENLEKKGKEALALGEKGCEQNTQSAPEACLEIRGLEETASFFNKSPATIKSWINDTSNPCPVIEKGGNGVAYKLDLRAVAKWLQERDERNLKRLEEQAELDNQLKLELLGGEEALPGFEGKGKLSARERAEVLRAEIDKTKLAQLRRELVNANEVKLKVSEALSLVSMQIRSLPDQLGRTLGWNEDDRQVSIEYLEDALNDLADKVATIGL